MFSGKVNDDREAPVQYNNKQIDNEEIIVKKEHDVEKRFRNLRE
jgi:hypothetical protein